MRFLCALLSVFALSACGRADAATTDLPAVTVEYFQQDSARVIARWARPCDAKGCADAYRVQWTAGAVSRSVTKTVTADTLRVVRPAVGDSLVATVAVTSVRRTIAGVTRSASAVVRNPDAPPPPVDSLRADTTFATLADSIGLSFYTATGIPIPAPQEIAEGDSIMLVARVFVPAGQTRHATDTAVWGATGSALMRLTPVRRGWQDTAYLVALDCRCTESGDPNHPPMLQLRSGEYAVRDRAGVRPVTPLSADPFR